MDDSEQHLKEVVQSIGEAMKTIPETMREETSPFSPPPWPREQMTVMYRHLCTDAGLPQRCPEARCRRTGQCHGGPGKGDGDCCEDLWDGALADRVFAAEMALALNWIYEAQRKRALAEWLTCGTFTDSDPFEEMAPR